MREPVVSEWYMPAMGMTLRTRIHLMIDVASGAIDDVEQIATLLRAWCG
ncbi:MAG: hypothetical protein ACXWD3_04705 [Mycobacterium sp.]